jgi:hypothetical protein
MRRGGTWLAAIGAVLALAACGGGDARPEEPGLPPRLAERLAAQSEAIADKLDAGDTCAAAQEADLLNDEAQAAIDAGDVPPALQAELMSTVAELVNNVNCPQPPPPPPPAADDCEELEEEKKELEEEKKDAEGAVKEQLEAQIKALEEQIKACREGEGNGKGKGNGNGGDD